MPNDTYPSPAEEPELFDAELEREATRLVENDPGFADFKEYAQLAAEAKRLKNALKKMEEEMKRRQKRLFWYFERGLRSPVTVDDITIYTHAQIYARARYPFHAIDVCRVLKQTSHGEFVYETYNTQRVAEWVRELKEAHQDELREGRIDSLKDLLDPRLAEVLDVEPTHSIRTCPAKRPGH